MNIVSESKTILQRCHGKLLELLDLRLTSLELEDQIDTVAHQIGISVWRIVEEDTAIFSGLRDFVEKGKRRVEELEREIAAKGSDPGKSLIGDVYSYEFDNAAGRWVWAKVEAPQRIDNPDKWEKAEYARIEDQRKQLEFAEIEAELKLLYRQSRKHFFYLVVMPWIRKNYSHRINNRVDGLTFLRLAKLKWPRDIESTGNEHALREWYNSDDAERSRGLRSYLLSTIDAIDILVEHLNAIIAVPPQSPMAPTGQENSESSLITMREAWEHFRNHMMNLDYEIAVDLSSKGAESVIRRAIENGEDLGNGETKGECINPDKLNTFILSYQDKVRERAGDEADQDRTG